MRRLSTLLFLTAAGVFAQVDDNTITITANRQVTLQPDQVVFYVSVQTPQSAGVEGALAMVQGAGITASDLTGVSSDIDNTIDWNFTLTAPLSQASGAITSLAQFQQQTSGAVSFIVQGTQVSQALQQSQGCSQSVLVADAQEQAQTLASAAGFTVGPVLAVSDGSGMQSNVRAEVPAVLEVLGTTFSLVGVAAPATPTTCTAVVQFQLYSYH